MARKVNTHFLIILTVVVVGMGMTALLAKRFIIRERPEKYLTAARELLAQERLEEAERNFRQAVALDQRNADTWVEYGDVLNQLSPVDPARFLLGARDAWQKALAADPTHKEALTRLLTHWSEMAEVMPSVENFVQLRTTAEQLAKVDPENTAAHAAIHSATIRRWLRGVETDQARIDEAIEKLTELMSENPANPDLPVFIAQAKVHKAQRLRQRNPTTAGETEAAKLVAEANAIIDVAVKAQPDSAAMYFGAAQVMATQHNMIRQRADERREYLVRAKELLDKGREVVSPEDPLYSFIFENAAQLARQLGERDEAEAILREVLKHRPNDPQIRLALVEHLAPDGRREEAIQLLDRPFVSSGLVGPRSIIVQELEVRTLAALANLRLDIFVMATPEERAKLTPLIEEGIQRVIMKEGEGVRSMMMRGKLQRVQGRVVEAIQTLERARELAERLGQPEQNMEYWEMIDLLARAYIETNQTGRAQQLLNRLVAAFDTYTPGRLLLAQLLLRENELDRAREHIEILKDQRGEDPDVLKLIIQTYNRDTERAEMVAAYRKLPEDNRRAMLDKINFAMALGESDDAVRITKLLLAEHPADPECVRLAVRVHRTREEFDEAREIVAHARTVDPDNDALKVLEQQVAIDPTQGFDFDTAVRIASGQTDPFMREMMLADANRRQGNWEQTIQHLQAAEKLRPDDPEPKLLLFDQYLTRRLFNEARVYIEPLARANQDQVGGLLIRYRYAMAREDLNAAIEHAREMVQRMPEFAQSWVVLGQALQQAKQYEDALSRYTVALEKQSNSVQALRGAIDCYYMLGRAGEAQRVIERARRTMPDNQMFLELEINHQLTYGDPERAIPMREEAMRKNPDDASAVVLAGRAYLAAGRARLRQGDTNNGIAFASKARALFTEGISRWPDEPVFYAYYAEAATQRRDLPDAEKMLRQLGEREMWRGRPEPLMLLGEFFVRTNRTDEAIEVLREASTLAPENVDILLRLSGILASQGKVDEALTALNPGSDDSRLVRARIEVLISSNRLDEADDLLRRVLAKTPDAVDLRAMFGSISLARLRFEEAESRLRQALELSPKHPLTHYYLGLLRLQQPRPDYDAAIEHLSIARQGAAIGVDARFALADCYQRKNDLEAAIRELEAALKINPNDRRVQVALFQNYISTRRWVDMERVLQEVKAAPEYRPDVQVLRLESLMWQEKGNMQEAAAMLGEALKLEPGDVGLSRDYLTLLIRTRNYKIVVEVTDRLIEADPARWWAYEARGVAKRYLNARDEAIVDFEAALNQATAQRNDEMAKQVVRTMAREIGYTEAQLRIRDRAAREPRWALMSAYLYQQEGKVTEAIAILERVLAVPNLSQADRETALHFGGSLYLQVTPKPQPEKAFECYRQLLELQPNDLIALNNMAYLLAEVMVPPRPREGLEYSRRAYDIMRRTNVREPAILDTHGWLLTLNGQVDEGIAILQSVVESTPLADAHYHLAEAYLKKAFPEEARKQLELASALVRRMKAENKPYDRSLEAKIENAIMRTQEMLRGRGQALR